MFTRSRLYNRIIELAAQDHIKLDKTLLHKKLARYSVDEIIRVVDAIERFGYEAITSCAYR